MQYIICTLSLCPTLMSFSLQLPTTHISSWPVKDEWAARVMVRLPLNAPATYSADSDTSLGHVLLENWKQWVV